MGAATRQTKMPSKVFCYSQWQLGVVSPFNHSCLDLAFNSVLGGMVEKAFLWG